MKILIVEDCENTRHILKDILEFLQHEVKTAINALEALHWYDDYLPDLVITDYNLDGSGHNGIDLLTMLKQKNKDALIVILTALNSVDLAVNALKLGALDFITKPISISAIERVLRQAENKLKENTIKTNNLQELSKAIIEKALKESNTYAEAASKLGIDVATLWRKRKAYGLKINKPSRYLSSSKIFTDNNCQLELEYKKIRHLAHR
jgi:DNA-binding NtrC family response regulator